MKDLGGILPAVVTPLSPDGRFAPVPFERLLQRLYEARVDGVYVAGQTGEGLLQTVEQRRLVAEAALKNSPPGKTVIVHVGAHRTADAVALARHAAEIRVHAVSSLPPFGSYSFAEIKSYYEAIAAASDLPVLVYYFPAAAPAISSAEQLLELCAIPNVIGLKFTAYDLYSLSKIAGSGAVVFNGHDEVLAAGLLMGASGGIGSFYNLVPELFVEVFRLAQSEQWESARAVQTRINELIEITLRFPALAALKAMLSWSGLDCGRCIGPRSWLTPGQEAELQSLLAASSFHEAAFAAPKIPAS